MSDLDSYLMRCYDLLSSPRQNAGDDEELCACANLIEHEERPPQPSTNQGEYSC